ncbi:hypothetical protein C7475_10112 [Chitinophaga sp. S165]|nr:hypothetical protein C7475_10112 [Chitinophaga sp. S165]
MIKARVVFTVLTLLAITGAALAFKIMRNGNPVFTTTTQLNANFTIYTRAGGATFCWTRSDMFFTLPPVGSPGINLLSTTAPATARYTLTRIGGTQTITIPNYCTVFTTTNTNITAID